MVLCRLYCGCKPVQPFVQPFTVGGAGRLDVPVLCFQVAKPQLVRNLGACHGVWQILLVGEDEPYAMKRTSALEESTSACIHWKRARQHAYSGGMGGAGWVQRGQSGDGSAGRELALKSNFFFQTQAMSSSRIESSRSE